MLVLRRVRTSSRHFHPLWSSPRPSVALLGVRELRNLQSLVPLRFGEFVNLLGFSMGGVSTRHGPPYALEDELDRSFLGVKFRLVRSLGGTHQAIKAARAKVHILKRRITISSEPGY